MRINFGILLLAIALVPVGCKHAASPVSSQQSPRVALQHEEASVIEALVGVYSSDSDGARPLLSSHFSTRAPDDITRLKQDYSRPLNSDYISTLAENPPEWLTNPEPEPDGKVIREALEDLQRVNELPADADQVGRLRTVPVVELNDAVTALEAASAGSAEQFWDGFNKKFPQSYGYATASRVGFSSNRSIAVVYFSWTGGPTLGLGCVHLFQRVNGAWRLVARWRDYGWTS
jgi:hypothetical protein